MPESAFHSGIRAVGKSCREGRETERRDCSRLTPIAPWAALGRVKDLHCLLMRKEHSKQAKMS